MKKIFSLTIFFALILGFCFSAFADTRTYEAEGVYVKGDSDTNIYAKEMALQDAKRLALEQAGVYLATITQVVNGEVTKDEISVIASGVIKLDKILHEENRLNNGVISLAVKARFIIDSDDLEKKIAMLKQNDSNQEATDLQSKHAAAADENKKLKEQITAKNEASKYLIKTKNVGAEALELYNSGAHWAGWDSGKALIMAIDDLSKAIAIEPQFADAYFFRGVCYYKKHQYDLAIADFSMAIAIESRYDAAYNCRGLSYDQQGQYDLAIADYTKAIALEPKHKTAYYNRASLYYKQSKYDSAIADYTKVIAIDPTYPDAYTYRGMSYYSQGKDYLALADFDKAVELDIWQKDARETRKILLKRLKSS